jgi:hypothetical protein
VLGSVKAERAVRRFGEVLSRLDALVGSRARIDGATAVYFIGRRSNSRVSPRQIVSEYRGAQVVAGGGG